MLLNNGRFGRLDLGLRSQREKPLFGQARRGVKIYRRQLNVSSGRLPVKRDDWIY